MFSHCRDLRQFSLRLVLLKLVLNFQGYALYINRVEVVLCVALLVPGDTIEALELSAKKKEMAEDFSVTESSAKSMLRDEFLINMQKFASSISRTIQQIEGEVKLECPDLPDLTDNMDDNLKNDVLREQVRRTHVYKR